MSRRRGRVRNDLSDLLGITGDLAASDRGQALATLAAPIARSLRLFVLPRLADPPVPFMVALVGSTGAGKSTLLNSVARRMISRPGVKRPTTRRPLVWTSPPHAGTLAWLGEVVTGDHPLLADLALIDTPDLDSLVPGHRASALEVMEAADAVVFVTTAARYADASPWRLLSEVRDMPMAVVINRTPSRADAARVDLRARLRRAGRGGVPVLTISEQRVDGGRLGAATVQRLTALLGEWAGRREAHRLAVMEAVTDRLVVELGVLRAAAATAAEAAERVEKLVRNEYQGALDRTGGLVGRGWWKATGWWRRARIDRLTDDIIRLLDQTAGASADLLEAEGIEVPSPLLRAAPATVDGLSSVHGASELRRRLPGLLHAEAARFIEAAKGPSLETVVALDRFHGLLTEIDWSHV